MVAVIIPVAVGLLLGPEGVSGLLAGNTVTGFVLAVMMANAGGAWDNAKKYIESGQLGGKGSCLLYTSDYSRIRFTFQEYFRRMNENPSRWSQPFSALLGAYSAQLGFGLPSIGGKDSMSGTFDTEDGEINVPPTLVSFAVDVNLSLIHI